MVEGGLKEFMIFLAKFSRAMPQLGSIWSYVLFYKRRVFPGMPKEGSLKNFFWHVDQFQLRSVVLRRIWRFSTDLFFSLNEGPDEIGWSSFVDCIAPVS